MSAWFEIFIGQGQSQEHYFRYIGANRTQILRSEGYASRQGAVGGAQSVKTNAVDPAAYDRLQSQDSRFYFNMKAHNGEVIATSQLYRTAEQREQAISDVQLNAPHAPIRDL